MTDKNTGHRPASGNGAQDPDIALGDNDRAGKPTGAGGEATEGIHGADGDRDPGDRTALEGKVTGRGDESGTDRAGSEPTTSHDREHKSNYGGGGANGGADPG